MVQRLDRPPHVAAAVAPVQDRDEDHEQNRARTEVAAPRVDLDSPRKFSDGTPMSPALPPGIQRPVVTMRSMSRLTAIVAIAR